MRLRVFGGLSVDGTPPGSGGAAGQRRPLALLLLLAAAGERGVSRDKLLGLLWPDSDAEHARSALRQTLYALRRDLALPDLVVGTAELRLNSSQLPSDLGEFDAAIRAGDRERAVALYTGPLADGFFLPRASEFERWLESERRTRAEQFADAAEALAREATRRGDHTRAVALWRRVASENRLSGRIAVELMRALAEAGDRSGAIEHARVHEALLRAELDAPPDRAVAALAEQLRSAPRAQEAASQKVAEPNGGAPAPQVRPDGEGATPPDPSSLSGVASAPSPKGLAAPTALRPRRRRAVLVAGSIAAAVLLGATVYFARARMGARLDPTLVAVAPYQIFDPSLALWREGLMDVLSHNLDGAGPLRTLSPSVAARRWAGGMHRAAAHEFSRRTGAAIVVSGYLMPAGRDSVRVVTSVVDGTSDRSFEIERREALARMDRLTDSVTVAILRRLDEWLPTRGLRRTTLARSSSIDALKAFLRGEQLYRRALWDSAQVFYEQAISYDTTFALAIHRLADVIGWLRAYDDSATVAYQLRAGALNRGLGPRDSLLLLADSLAAAAIRAPTLLGEWPFVRRLMAVLQYMVRRYPDDPDVWYAAADGQQHFAYGPVLSVQEDALLKAFDRVIQLDSAFAPAYMHAIELALNVGGPQLARRYIDAYLRRHSHEAALPVMRLVGRLLEPGALQSPEVRQQVDTVAPEVLVEARTATRHWPDSAETAVWLARQLVARGRGVDPVRVGSLQFRTRILAEQLAFRGHMAEAHRLLGGQDAVLAFDLTFGAPADSIDARIARLVRRGSQRTQMAMHWWGLRRDSVSLRWFLADAQSRLRSDTSRVTRMTAAYDTAAAQAYLALVRRDTVEALARFIALPDTLCVRCHADRLTRSRLLLAAGRPEAALPGLHERLLIARSPFRVLFAFERGRAAERLRERETAARAYRFVVDAWGRGDAAVQAYVADARRGLARLEGGSP